MKKTQYLLHANITSFTVLDFIHLHIIQTSLYKDSMSCFDEFVHGYGWNLSILWSPLNIWMPQNFTIAKFGHPVSKSWLRPCFRVHLDIVRIYCTLSNNFGNKNNFTKYMLELLVGLTFILQILSKNAFNERFHQNGHAAPGQPNCIWIVHMTRQPKEHHSSDKSTWRQICDKKLLNRTELTTFSQTNPKSLW